MISTLVINHEKCSVLHRRTLPRARTPLQLAIICSLSSSEIHSPNKASTVPAFLPSVAAAGKAEGAEEGKSVWILRGVGE